MTHPADAADRDILVVDDEPLVRRILERWLAEFGYPCRLVADAAAALRELEAKPPQLVICDVNLPGMDGLQLLERVRTTSCTKIAFIMISGLADERTALSAVDHGAYDYITKPFDHARVRLSISTAMQRHHDACAADLQQTAFARATRRQEEEGLLRLLWAAECRDDITGGHIRRIGRSAAVLARTLNWPEADVDRIRYAAALHDIGKIGVPDAILCKPSLLTEVEFEEMKSHTVTGSQILRGGSTPTMIMAAEIAASHHEHWDGTGYPAGLCGPQIPEAARLVAVVDVYDSLVNDRPYRRALPEDEALRIMRELRGKKFEPRMLDGFLAALPQLREIQAAVAPTDVDPPMTRLRLLEELGAPSPSASPERLRGRVSDAA